MSRQTGVFVFAAVALLAGAVLAAQTSGQNRTASGPITFNKAIAPIIWQNCATCHRPGQLGPFSLVTFEDVRPRAREIVRAVKSQQMPPWKPEPGYGDFAGVRKLSGEQIALIQRWVDQGSRQGDARDLPQSPAWAPGWQLGQPDLVVSMPDAYELTGKGPDVFRTFVVPIPLISRRYVRALEFNPGDFKAVHHANIKVDHTRLSRDADEAEPGPGYEGGGSREAKFPDGHFLGWTPGQSPRVSPQGMAWRLEPGSDLVIELHLMPTGTTEPVQASVGLFFTDAPPTETPYILRLGRQDLDIAAGQRDYVNTDSYILPVDVDVLGVQPHAHYLAREVRGFATLPDESVRQLIYIKDWDFHWQDVYQLATPMPLPKNTVLTMRYTYDNSAENPRNPNKPARRVTFGQTSASEMGNLWIQVLPHNAADLQTLDRDFTPKILADDIAGDEKWLEMNPRNARLHAELAACYVEAGRMSDALAHVREAARLDPTPLRHYDVGRVLVEVGRFPDAAAAFQQALELKPAFPEGLYGLALALDAQGKVDEAIQTYVRAIDLNPVYGDAHFNLARLFASQRKYAEAMAHYRQALRLRPEDAEAMVELASILATADEPDIRNPAEGVRLAEQAAALTNHRDPMILDRLATCYAQAGQTDRAIATAQDALRLATAAGNTGLAIGIRVRLNSYRLRTP